MKLFKLCLCVKVKIKFKFSDEYWVFHLCHFSWSIHFLFVPWFICLTSGNFIIFMYASPQFNASFNDIVWALVFPPLNPRAFNIEVISLSDNSGIRSDKCLVHLHLSFCGLPLIFPTLLKAGPSTSSLSSFMLCETIGYFGWVCRKFEIYLLWWWVHFTAEHSCKYLNMRSFFTWVPC